MSFLQRIAEVNYHSPNRCYFELFVNNNKVGIVDEQIIPILPKDIFIVNDNKININISNNKEYIEKEIEKVFKNYFYENNMTVWRDEYYPVSSSFDCKPFFLIERSILSYLGIVGYGVHVNGFARLDNGDISMWVSKRSKYKQSSPGKLDQIAAGGIPYGISVMENLIKECKEEANIPSELSRRAKKVSQISYLYELPVGIRPDVVFNYDLELPIDFTPRVNDGEVEGFYLLPINEILTIILETNDFKFNSALVIIDFAIRHGFIDKSYTDYTKIIHSLYHGGAMK